MANYLILCAGYGSRLKPLTDSTPKPLIKLNETSILERLFSQIHNVDSRAVLFINIHYKAHQFIDTLKSFASKLPINVIWETRLLGSANSLDVAFAKSCESFFVLHGDLFLAQQGLADLYGFQTLNPDTSILVTHARSAKEARSLVQVKGSEVINFVQGGLMINREGNQKILSSSGIYFLHKSDLSKFSRFTNSNSSIEETLIPKILNESNLLNYTWTFPRISIENTINLDSARLLEQKIL